MLVPAMLAISTEFERLQRSSSLRNAFEHPKGDVFFPVA
jgi:hypothetical protein